MESKASEGTEVEDRSRSESLNELEGKKKRTYVRRDVQRRKEQNAQAQKKFRWKKKVMAEQVSWEGGRWGEGWGWGVGVVNLGELWRLLQVTS